jgi:hypothetical protein
MLALAITAFNVKWVLPPDRLDMVRGADALLGSVPPCQLAFYCAAAFRPCPPSCPMHIPGLGRLALQLVGGSARLCLSSDGGSCCSLSLPFSLGCADALLAMFVALTQLLRLRAVAMHGTAL